MFNSINSNNANQSLNSNIAKLPLLECGRDSDAVTDEQIKQAYREVEIHNHQEKLKHYDKDTYMVLRSKTADAILSSLPLIDKALYVCCLMPYMDRTTGIVGHKRRVSLKSIRDTLTADRRQGLTTHNPTPDGVRGSIKRLQAAGLLSQNLDTTPYNPKDPQNKRHLIYLCNFEPSHIKKTFINVDNVNQLIETQFKNEEKRELLFEGKLIPDDDNNLESINLDLAGNFKRSDLGQKTVRSYHGASLTDTSLSKICPELNHHISIEYKRNNTTASIAERENANDNFSYFFTNNGYVISDTSIINLQNSHQIPVTQNMVVANSAATKFIMHHEWQYNPELLKIWLKLKHEIVLDDGTTHTLTLDDCTENCLKSFFEYYLGNSKYQLDDYYWHKQLAHHIYQYVVNKIADKLVNQAQQQINAKLQLKIKFTMQSDWQPDLQHIKTILVNKNAAEFTANLTNNPQNFAVCLKEFIGYHMQVESEPKTHKQWELLLAKDLIRKAQRILDRQDEFNRKQKAKKQYEAATAKRCEKIVGKRQDNTDASTQNQNPDSANNSNQPTPPKYHNKQFFTLAERQQQQLEYEQQKIEFQNQQQHKIADELASKHQATIKQIADKNADLSDLAADITALLQEDYLANIQSIVYLRRNCNLPYTFIKAVFANFAQSKNWDPDKFVDQYLYNSDHLSHEEAVRYAQLQRHEELQRKAQLDLENLLESVKRFNFFKKFNSQPICSSNSNTNNCNNDDNQPVITDLHLAKLSEDYYMIMINSTLKNHAVVAKDYDLPLTLIEIAQKWDDTERAVANPPTHADIEAYKSALSKLKRAEKAAKANNNSKK